MSFVLGNAPLPMTDPIARPRRRELFGEKRTDPLEGLLSDAWADYLSRLAQTVQHAATRISGVSRTEQAAAISATDISGGTLKSGLYRLTYHARITTASELDSSLIVTLSWTDGGVAQSQAGADITGNTTDTLQSASFLIHADASTPIRYATAYGYTGATPMQYRLDVVLEVIDA
jgi:hypothetical protein